MRARSDSHASSGRSARSAARGGLLTAIALPLAVAAALAAPRSASAQVSCPARPTPAPPCVSETSIQMDRSPVLAGEQVEVTLRAKAECRADLADYHVVFVVDGEGDRRGADLAAIRDAVLPIVAYLDGLPTIALEVGAIGLSDEARRLCPLGTDPRSMAACIGRLEAGAGATLAEGIEEARLELRRARCRGAARELAELIVIVADRSRVQDCAEARASSRRADREGIGIALRCLDDACEDGCLVQVATAPLPGTVEPVFMWLLDPSPPDPTATPGPSPTPPATATRAPEGWVRLAILELTLAPGVSPVGGNADLPADVFADDGMLAWAPPAVSLGAEVSLPFRFTRAGRQSPFLSGRLILVDEARTVREHAVSTPPPLLVLRPDRLPGPPSATPTITRTPSVTPTPTMTPSPAPPPPPPVYLPYMKRLVDAWP